MFNQEKIEVLLRCKGLDKKSSKIFQMKGLIMNI
jgi:hypothetical protein